MHQKLIYPGSWIKVMFGTDCFIVYTCIYIIWCTDTATVYCPIERRIKLWSLSDHNFERSKSSNYDLKRWSYTDNKRRSAKSIFLLRAHFQSHEHFHHQQSVQMTARSTRALVALAYCSRTTVPDMDSATRDRTGLFPEAMTISQIYTQPCKQRWCCIHSQIKFDLIINLCLIYKITKIVMDAIGIIKNAKPIYFIFSIIIVFFAVRLRGYIQTTLVMRWKPAHAHANPRASRSPRTPCWR